MGFNIKTIFDLKREVENQNNEENKKTKEKNQK